MFPFLRRKPGTGQPKATIASGFTQPESAALLLEVPRRRNLLENIWQRTSLSRKQFESLYLAPLRHYAALVQHLPASENHHHAYPGGMLDHGLEIVAYALKIRQNYLLPIGAPPESQAAQAEAWSVAAAYGALVHDLGKIAVDVQVELQDGKTWHPWHGPLEQPYRFRYVKGRDYRLHGAASALLYASVLPAKSMDWLSEYPELWAQLLFTLAGQHEHAGILGEIVTQADQASVAQELGGNPTRAMVAPKQSLQRQVVEALRMLVRDKFRLNQPDGPSDGWLTQDALWLVSKPAVDQLRAALLSQGIEHIPSSNAPMFNLLQDQAIIQTNANDKAIWSATVDTGQGWKNTFTLLKVAPALIWPQADERPPAYAGTITIEAAEPLKSQHITDNTDVASETLSNVTQITPKVMDPPPEKALIPLIQSDFDPMEDLLTLFGDEPDSQPGAASAELNFSPASPPPEAPITRNLQQPKSEPARIPQPADLILPPPVSSEDHGSAFLTWLKMGVISHKIIINDAKARVHTVDGTAFLVSPDIFKRYALEHPAVQEDAKARGLEPWQLVQRAFEKQRRHRKTVNNLNIWTCLVKGPRKVGELRGYLLSDPKDVFSDVPYDNAVLTLKVDAPKDAAQ